jgi:uncharacterized membrane protein YeaQ/YmgE (transglycosylase-associated protein family)
MRIYFPKYDPGVFLTAKRDARWIIAFIIICFLAGLCGSYLLGNHFGLLAIMLLGIVGILLGGAAYALFNWNKAAETPRGRVNKSVPRTTSGWDYRPREAIRRYTGVDRPPPEVVSATSSARSENDYVWFNALECPAHTFIDASPDVPGAHDECALVADPDIVCTEGTVDDGVVWTYDLSPIDNQTAVAE